MGVFVMQKSKSGKYMFNLKAGNGAIVATSAQYDSKKDCEKDINILKNDVATAMLEDQTVKGYGKESSPKFELYKDNKDQFRFRMVSKKGDIIVKSEGYTVKASCKNGIASVIKNAPGADVLE